MGVRDGSGAIKVLGKICMFRRQQNSVEKENWASTNYLPFDLIISKPQFTALINGDTDSCLPIF